MALGIGFNVSSNYADINKALVKFGRELQQKVYLKLMHQRFLKWVNDNFRNQGTERAWKPLSPNTIAARRLSGSGGVQILRDTGRMAQSFNPGQPLSGSRVDINAGMAVVGTEDWKAPIHHFGTRPFQIRPRNKKWLVFKTAGGMVFSKMVNHPGIPARPILPSVAAGNQMIQDVGNAYLKRIVDQANKS